MLDTSRLKLTLLPEECFTLIMQNYSLEGLIHLAKNPTALSTQNPMLFTDGKRLGLDSNALAQKLRLQSDEKKAIRTAALQVLQEHLEVLILNKIRLTGKPGCDEPHLILEQTIRQQQREISTLLKNNNHAISPKQKTELNAAISMKTRYVGDLIAIDVLLNEVNMILIQPRLDAYESAPEEQQWYLNLDWLGLTRLPEPLIVKLQSYPRLTALELSLNQLSSLPDSFGSLVTLTQLSLKGNQLAALPDSFGCLVALTKLFLSRNLLTALPESFGNLVALTALWIDDNQLTTLPESFRKLEALKIFFMPYNEFIAFSEATRQILIQTNNQYLLPLLTSRPGRMDKSNDSDEEISVATAIYTPGAATVKKQGQKRKAAEEEEENNNTAAKAEEKPIRHKKQK